MPDQFDPKLLSDFCAALERAPALLISFPPGQAMVLYGIMRLIKSQAHLHPNTLQLANTLAQAIEQYYADQPAMLDAMKHTFDDLATAVPPEHLN